MDMRKLIREKLKPADSPSSGAAMSGIIAYSTSNYEAMRDFFAAIGFEVSEENHQLIPLFERKRGSYVQRGDIVFNLEESEDKERRASVNFLLFGYSDAEMQTVLSKVKSFKKEDGLFSSYYTSPTPDGGKVTIEV
jgi:hypothetical protein